MKNYPASTKHTIVNLRLNLGLFVWDWTRAILFAGLCHLHWSVKHYQVTFEWHSVRGSETSNVVDFCRQALMCICAYVLDVKNSKSVWSGNTTITNRRQTNGTARKSHTTITRHQENRWFPNLTLNSVLYSASVSGKQYGDRYIYYTALSVLDLPKSIHFRINLRC